MLGLLDRAFQINLLKLTYQAAVSTKRPDAKTPERQVQHRLTAMETTALLAARQAGASIRQLALQFHVCPQTVRRVIESSK